MATILTSTGVTFSDGFEQTRAAKSYTQQRYTSSSNIGATTISFTGIPTDAKSILVVSTALGFSSGPNAPKVELWSGTTLLTGTYRAFQNVSWSGGSSYHSASSANSSFSNLLYLNSYSEAYQFIIEIKRVPSQAAVDYMYTVNVNTGGTYGNHNIGTGQISTTAGSYIGFDKIVVGNGSGYNIVTSDISIFYK